MKKIFISLTLIAILCACSKPGPVIKMETELGNIVLELYPEKAPVTVENFLRYVDEGRLEKAVFYRVVTMDNQPDNDVKIEVIQGGIWWTDSLSMLEPIAHETTEQTGILHLDGTLSMARYTPGTATSEFFICVNDQPSLDFEGSRNSDGQGFAAFGRVIEGMEVVRKIHTSPEENQALKPFIKILSVERSN